MPRFYHCGVPGCNFGDWRFLPHECPEPIHGTTRPIENPVPKKTVNHITGPTPPSSRTTDVDGSNSVSQDDNCGSARKRNQKDTSKDPPVYIFQYPDFSDDKQDVVIMTWRKDKSCRLIIVLPFDERGVKYFQKYLKYCLKLCISDSQRFRTDSNGFTAIIDRMEKKEDVKFVVKTLNRELKGSLKLILIVKSHIKTETTVNEINYQTTEFQKTINQHNPEEIVIKEAELDVQNALENESNLEDVPAAGAKNEPVTYKPHMIGNDKDSQFVAHKQIVDVITKPRNSSFSQAGVTRFCNNTDAIDSSSSDAQDETNDTITNLDGADLSNASDCFDGICATTNIATLSDGADEPQRTSPCIPKYLPHWRLTEYVGLDQLDAILPHWNK